ncbi:hypothetical protein G6F56_013811 [Rhizopus delemar]|nr:hypothetical protein G6F56_013811 [Rhizopus delemar]
MNDEYDIAAAAAMDCEYDDIAAAMDCEYDDIAAAALDDECDIAAALDTALDEQSHEVQWKEAVMEPNNEINRMEEFYFEALHATI